MDQSNYGLAGWSNCSMQKAKNEKQKKKKVAGRLAIDTRISLVEKEEFSST
jgi:hypothetical protein